MFVIRWGIWWVCFKNLDEHEAEAWTLEGGGSLMQCDFGIKVLSRFQSGTVGFGLDSNLFILKMQNKYLIGIHMLAIDPYN